MLEKHIAILNEVRHGHRDISEFNLEIAPENPQGIFDAHQQKRYQLLLALQHDPRPEDEPLLQHLLQQEIARACQDPFQGMNTGMSLCAALLSRFKNVRNVWLFIEAKQANFDTSCGLDYEYLVSADIEATYRYVQQHASPLKEIFYNVVGDSIEECFISPEALITWEQQHTRQGKAGSDTPEMQLWLAVELKEYDILREKLEIWKTNTQHWSAEQWSLLAHYEGVLDNIKGQIFAYERMLLLETRPFVITGNLLHLCSLYIKNSDAENAWLKFKELISKEEYYNGYSVTHALNIILLCNNNTHPIAREAYAWVQKAIPHLPPAQYIESMLEPGAQAALLMNDMQLHTQFTERIEAIKKSHRSL